MINVLYQKKLQRVRYSDDEQQQKNKKFLPKKGLSFLRPGNTIIVRLSRIPPVSKAYKRFAFFYSFLRYNSIKNGIIWRAING